MHASVVTLLAASTIMEIRSARFTSLSTETLSMFMALALSVDARPRQAVDDTAAKRMLGAPPLCGSKTAAYCKGRMLHVRPWSFS